MNYNNIYYIYTYTCLPINNYKISYSRYFFLKMQASFNFIQYKAIKILFISLQYLFVLLLNFSTINFYLSICFSNFLLFIYSYRIITFSLLIFNLVAYLLFDSVINRYFYLLILRVSLILSWCRLLIFVTKLTFDLRNSRNLFNN